MALSDKFKKLMGGDKKIVSKDQIEAFLNTEEGEDLIISKVQSALPDFFKEASKQEIKEEKTKEPEKEIEKEENIFEEKSKKEGDK